MKKTLPILGIVALLSLCSVNAFEIGEGVTFAPSHSNTEYIANTTLVLSSFGINETALFFNDSIFQCLPSTNSITVYINRWNPPTIINYDVVCTSGTVTHNMGGFVAGNSYEVFVDSGLPYQIRMVNSTGAVNFTYSSWSRHRFQIGSGPLAGFVYTPTSPIAGERIDFTDISTDVDGTIVAWNWSFGDPTGSTSNQRKPHFTYYDQGEYTVTLTVTDNDSYQDTEIQAITVGGSGPSSPSEEHGFTVTTIELTVTTIDDSYNPISNVRVYIYAGSTLVDFAHSSSNGVATFTLEEDSYTIKASKDGYEDTSTTVMIDKDMPITLMLEEVEEEETFWWWVIGGTISIIAVAGVVVYINRKK